MTIALSRAASRLGYRWALSGSVSANASWSQTLNFPSDDDTLVLTSLDVRLTFQRKDQYRGWDYGWLGTDQSACVALSTDDGQITVDDADTISIDATTDDLSGLCQADYAVDIASKDGSGNITHLAHGNVIVRSSPPSWP